MRENKRKDLAKSNYLNPKSSTFGNRAASLRKAGYSNTYAEHFGSKILADIELTDEDIANFKGFVEDLPELVAVTRQKIKQLKKSDNISAKDYSAVLRHIELISRFAGVFKNVIQKKVEIIKIEIPKEIVDKEYERRGLKRSVPPVQE